MRALYMLMLAIAGALLASPVAAATDGRQKLGVASAIELRRLFYQAEGNSIVGTSSPVTVSPNGQRYLVRLLKGDVKKDGDWLEFYVGNSSTLSLASKPRLVARLFTRGYEHPPVSAHLLEEGFNPVVWLDDSRVAMRWTDARDIAQVVSLDLRTGKVRYLTHSVIGIPFFSAGPHESVIYSTDADPKGMGVLQRDAFGGTVITAGDGIALAEGKLSGTSSLDRMYDRDFYVIGANSKTPKKVTVKWRAIGSNWLGLRPIWSADGRFVILDTWADNPPPAWRNYLSVGVGESFKRTLSFAFRQPDSWYGRFLSRLYVVDTKSGHAWPLWDAPDYNNYDNKVLGSWSPDGRRVVVGPTLLPPDTSNRTASSNLAVAVIDVRSGHFVVLPTPQTDFDRITNIAWKDDSSIIVEAGGTDLEFANTNGGWSLSTTKPISPPLKSTLKFTVRQGLNSPPVLWAADPNQDGEILDPNPHIGEQFTLGHVEKVIWADGQSRQQSGKLYYPPNYRSGQRYPLVIQIGNPLTSEDDFDLYGAGWGAGLGPSQSVYAAQQLAGHNMMVLAVARIVGRQGLGEEQANAASWEAAIKSLDASRLIDTSKVGLSGESRNGWLIKQIVAATNFPYAAAISSDAFDSGYMMRTLMPDFTSDIENGATPFGAGLKNWLERSAAFNADRIRTPLRLVDESDPGAGMLNVWELFSRLRSLDLPVEYYVIPEIRYGSHILENPFQLMAVKQGAVDWFDFWLNDQEDPDPSKKDQYRRWRILRTQRDAALKRPRPPKLEWSATPLIH